MTKQRLLLVVGILLCLPFPCSIALSVTGMIAGRADYEKWLFEGVFFKMLDWAHGSYWKALILWLGPPFLFVAYIYLLVYCFTYECKRLSRRPARAQPPYI